MFVQRAPGDIGHGLISVVTSPIELRMFLKYRQNYNQQCIIAYSVQSYQGTCHQAHEIPRALTGHSQKESRSLAMSKRSVGLARVQNANVKAAVELAPCRAAFFNERPSSGSFPPYWRYVTFLALPQSKCILN